MLEKNNRRVNKINEILLREISYVLNSIIRNENITNTRFLITRVSTTKDFSYSMIYIKPMYEKDEKCLIKHLNHASSKIGFIVAPKIKLRRFPRLHFKIDKGFGRYEESGILDINSL